MIKWIIAAVLVFCLAIAAGLYISDDTDRSGTEVGWRLLGQMDYISNQSPPELSLLDGKRVKIPGFIVPLEDEQRLTGCPTVPVQGSGRALPFSCSINTKG